MTMSILRRVTGLIPTPVTSAPAPRPAPGVDVTHTPQRPGPTGEPAGAKPTGTGQGPAAAVTSTDGPSIFRSGPPSYRPGVCHHDFHADHNGSRLGFLVGAGGRATWLACEHAAKDGR